jgi:hypothetical protein
VFAGIALSAGDGEHAGLRLVVVPILTMTMRIGSVERENEVVMSVSVAGPALATSPSRQAKMDDN